MATQPKSPLHHITITDFRPGIYSDIRVAADAGGVLDAQQPGMAAEGTIGCIANTTGQLVPLPKGTPNYDLLDVGSLSRPVDGDMLTVGMFTVGPISHAAQTNNDDIFYFVNFAAANGGSGTGISDCYQSFVNKGGTGAISLQIFTGKDITLGTDLSRRGISSVVTRGRRSTFTSPGFPIVAWEYTSGEPHHDGALAQYVVYPDPNNLGTDTFYHEDYTIDNATFALNGQLIAHSGRILRLCECLTLFGLNVAFETNERVRFTDPPNNVVLSGTTTDSILDPQIPGGYGSWGSISFGELLLIKRTGGALLVQGDVYAPQITRLPGVADIGALTNVATSTPLGLVYCCENDGAYIWFGGSTSNKISTINDRFHTPPSPISYGIRTASCLWNNWVIFTNGWLYDTVTKSWWQLDVSQALPGENGLQWMAAGQGSQQFLYVLPGTGTSDEINVGRYNALDPSDTYTWISQPLPPSYEQSIDIREVSITLSNLTGDTTVTFFFFDITGVNTGTETFTVPGGPFPGPIRLRKPIGVRGNSVYFSLIASSTAIAPTINAIDIGYIPAQPLPQSNA